MKKIAVLLLSFALICGDIETESTSTQEKDAISDIKDLISSPDTAEVLASSDHKEDWDEVLKLLGELVSDDADDDTKDGSDNSSN